jgi:hypothetical protein
MYCLSFTHTHIHTHTHTHTHTQPCLAFTSEVTEVRENQERSQNSRKENGKERAGRSLTFQNRKSLFLILSQIPYFSPEVPII